MKLKIFLRKFSKIISHSYIIVGVKLDHRPMDLCNKDNKHNETALNNQQPDKQLLICYCKILKISPSMYKPLQI